MDIDRDLGVDTLLQHLGEEEKILGAVTPPIFQNSLFLFPTVQELFTAITETPSGPNHHYSRISNPTVDLAEQKIAMLEGTEACKVFGNGMAAISAAILSCVMSGSHIVAPDTCYGPLRDFVSKYLHRFGVTYTWVDGRNPQDFYDAVRPETTIIYLEAPSSLVFRMQDIEPICKFAKERGITTMIDNTYNTPIHCQPAKFGVDIILHSATKYMGGHSDLTAGALCASQDKIDQIIRGEVAYLGGILHPFSSWLLTRGLRTLSVRIKRHQETGNSVAKWLEQQPEIRVVHHLGLDSYAQKELVEKYLTGTSSLFSFEPKVQDEAKVMAFCNSLKLFGKGISWGGFESLVVAIPMQCSGYEEPRWIVRLYCGLEDPQDLIADLDEALAQLR
ncbi:aminotransferase class I/II-fold pyridoxal phosphate-dependent enzyme [soil metagenome]